MNGMKISKALTWDNLADEYKKVTGQSARIRPMDAIFDWAAKQNDKFFVDNEKCTIHKIINKEGIINETLRK